MTREQFLQIYVIREEKIGEDYLFKLFRRADNQQMFNLRLSLRNSTVQDIQIYIPISIDELLNKLRRTAEDFFFSIYENS
jgi:hypothetical protein